MTHHTAAYFESADSDSAFIDINALDGGVLSIRNNAFFLDEPHDLIYGFAGAAAMVGARLDSPTLRQVARPHFNPLGNAAIPGTEPRVADFTEVPITIPAQEEVKLQVAESTGVATDINGVIGLMTQRRPTPSGTIIPIRLTSTATATADAWTNLGTPTLETTLPAGNYFVVGLAAFSANMIAARLNFQSVNGQKERPGAVGAGAATEQIHPIFRNGRLGIWGEFNNVILPAVDVFCAAADASFVFILDVIHRP